VALRADAGYFAGALARAAHDEHIASAIGARRIAPLWRLLEGIREDGWRDAIDMDNAQVAVADYRPGLVAGEHPPQMALIPDQGAVQELAAASPVRAENLVHVMRPGDIR
jgi:hypothetical protein